MLSLGSRIAQALGAWTRGDAGRPGAGYKAFVSYNHHVSTRFALRLEQALKAYGKPLLARPIRIFRDEKHFAPGVDLPKLIVDALDTSEFLILLASPEAAGSPWVRDEVDYWCGELKRTRNLIVVLVGGEVVTDNETKRIDWKRTNALPPVLEVYLEQVPLYVDIRNAAHIADLTLSNPDFKKAVNGITARFRGIDPNEMLGEEIHQHRRNLRLRNGAAAALVVLTLASTIAAYVAVKQREQARQQAKIAVSRQYAAEAANLIENHLDEAILRAVKAVTMEQTFEARNLLFQALSYSPEIGAFLYRTSKDDEPAVSAFNPAGNQVAFATADTLHLFELTEPAGLTSREVRLSFPTISSVVYSRSGSTIAVGGDDGSISLINTSHWTMIGSPLNVSNRSVDRLFFGVTDDRLFAVSDGKLFSLYLADGGLSLTKAVQIGDPAISYGAQARYRVYYETTATSDGRSLVTGDHTRVVVWDLAGPIQQRYSFDIPHRFTVAIREIAISPHGETLAVDLLAGSDGIPVNFLELYSIDGVASDREITFKHQVTITTHKYLFHTSRLAFNNKGDHLLIGDQDGPFHLVDLKVLRERIGDSGQGIDLTTSNGLGKLADSVNPVTVKGLSGPVYNPRFAPDDSRVVLGVGARIVLWNFRPQPKFSRTLITHEPSPRNLAFVKDGGTLVLAADNGSIYRWNIPGGTLAISTQSATANGTSFITGDGRRLAVVEGDQLSFKDTLTGRELYKRALEGWMPLAMNPDGGLIAEFRQGILRMFNVSTSGEAWRTQLYDERQIAHPPMREPGVSFSKDGTLMVVHVFATDKLTEWNAASGRRLEVFGTGAERAWDWAPAVSPDGMWIVTAANNYSLGVINTVTREIGTVEAPGNICGVAFSPNSAHLAVSYEREAESSDDAADARVHPADYGVLFWDLGRKQAEAPTIKVSSPPCQVVFNPNGDRLAIATQPEDNDEQAQVLVWDVDPKSWAKLALRHIMYQPSLTP
jgi:WD40 repeat protein